MSEIFIEAKEYALSEIEFINYELGRMGREEGRKPERKKALEKFIEIIDLYNIGDYERIADMKFYDRADKTP